MTSAASAGRMRLTRPLRPSVPHHPLEIHPLAKLHEDGWLELMGPSFPPLGPVRLALWRPGDDPPFLLVEGEIARGWRWLGAPQDAYVVCWVSATAPEKGL